MTNRDEATHGDEPVALRDPATGGHLAFCNDECLRSLTSWVQPGAPSWRWRLPLPNLGVCLHCAWCGHIVSAPEICAFHETGCQADVWLLTLQGLGVQAALYGEVADELLPGVLAALEHIGRARPDLDGRALVRYAFGSDG